jgi:hypothetical protein
VTDQLVAVKKRCDALQSSNTALAERAQLAEDKAGTQVHPENPLFLSDSFNGNYYTDGSYY